MNKTTLVELLCELDSENINEFEGDLDDLLKLKVESVLQKQKCTFDDILANISSITSQFDSEKITNEWRYICLHFHILDLIDLELSKAEMEVLSVQETRQVKSALRNLMTIGVLKNLQPNLPHYTKRHKSAANNDIIYNYNVLKCTVCGFIDYCKRPNLRMLFLPHSLQGILTAAFQIAHCPLKKPNTLSNHQNDNNFKMSEEIYEKLVRDQGDFRTVLITLRESIHPSILVKEMMALFQADSPLWFKKSISNMLTSIIRSKNGVESIALAMLDGTENDTAKCWKILDVLTKLIVGCRNFPDFDSNICVQVESLLNTCGDNNGLFEQLYASCAKSLYNTSENGRAVFVDRIIEPLTKLTDHNRNIDDVTDAILRPALRVAYEIFAGDRPDSPNLPLALLQPIIGATFHLYQVLPKDDQTKNALKDILQKYLQYASDNREIDSLFDYFLFGFVDSSKVVPLRSDVEITTDSSATIKVTKTDHCCSVNAMDATNAIFQILDTDLKTKLFGYLLKCITEKDKYFHNNTSDDLVALEDSNPLNPALRRLVATHQLLSQLSDDVAVQKSIRTQPDNIIQYVNDVFAKTIATKSYNVESNFQSLFLIVMIVEQLVSNANAGKTLEKFKVLEVPLREILAENFDSELGLTCRKILDTLKRDGVQCDFKEEMSDVDKALNDLADPLLPVRGHALMVLTKLVAKKDKEAMARKKHLLNLFQLNLKNDDSYIYLTAVDGLAALADAFPGAVVEVLCEEYADVAGKSSAETRMKLGEVLVKVTKLLGEMAPKYKPLLLNTFLSGSKDDDHLLRASSLANLGEVCKVLGYKLGTIITEVMVCVHAVISTDKAPEPRRAAVSVIRQLFAGLKGETISFLKEDILPMYRTLKEIYRSDEDDVMRLQAQLALEELNENMKSFVFPKPQLSLDKKIILMDS